MRIFSIAIPTGLDNGLQDIIGVRPFGTERPDVTGQGAYGINGPPVTMNSDYERAADRYHCVGACTFEHGQSERAASEPHSRWQSNGCRRTDSLMAASTPTPLAIRLSDENMDTSTPRHPLTTSR